MLVLQQIVNGLSIGGIYALLALGFALCISVLNILNVAQGHFYMLGAFFTYQVLNSAPGLGYFLTLIIVIAAVALVGFAVHRVGVRPLYGQGYVPVIMAMLALDLLMEQMAILGWPGLARTMETPFNSQVLRWGEIAFNQQRLLIFVVAMLITLLLYTFLRWTRAGKALRATTQNQASAELVGINTEWMRALALVIAAGLGATAGGLIGPLFPVTSGMAWPMLWKVFVISIIGGVGSVFPAVAAGLLLGLFESLFGGLVSGQWTTVVEFGGIILLLLLRPQGLFALGATR